MPRIMIADDNTNIQKMVVLAFEERGIDVVAVGNGEAAVRRLADANPDLILADVFMPVRNGYEVCEFVKKDSRFSHVPVILLVGAFDPLDEKEARRVGADGVLKKPFVPPDPLIAMVMSALEKNPKIAAELAKAREVPVDPPPPPMPALEIPAKAEPKPLPEFPEPTPEEAAAIYGFGKGVRSLDDEDVAAGKEPKAPVMDEEEEPAEDFDGAATTNDWRRKSGMDIQIPENVASEPSFSYGRDVSPALFPSEHDVPPKRIHVSDEIVEQEAVARDAASPISNAPKQETPSVDDFFHPAARPQPEAIPAQQQVQAPAASQQADAEFTPPPRVRSWMDMMAPLPSEHPATNASVTQPTAEIAQPQASSAAPVAEPESISPAPAIFEHRPAPKDFEEYPPKKKSWFTDAVEAVREAVHSVVQEGGNEAHQVDASDSTDAIQQDIHEPAHEPAPQPVSSAASISSNDLIADHVAATPSRKDPALEEPPAAHVTAEPLLVRDEPSAPSGYGIRTEDTSPAHSFLPAPAEAQFEEDASSNGGHSFFEPPPQEPAPRVSEPADYGERIPTAPPPNREALAEIPFLMPPTAHKDSGKVDQDTVDAVVARVLEKLEPQLHDLLSKGVLKPLIENMLQGELAKKEK